MKKKLSLAKEKIKIVLLEGVHGRAVDSFREYGYSQVERLPHALRGEPLLKKIRNAHMIGIRSRTQLTSEILANGEKLMAVGCFCIGTNQVDLHAAALQGIPVFNAPHANTRSVAELVIGHTIMLFREIFAKSTAAHGGKWLKSASGSHEVRGKVMGIVGYGHIGSQVSVLAESMGMRVVFFDIQSCLPMGNAAATESLEDLLRISDIVTLHVPEDETTRNMIDHARLALMKPGAYLINASRGSVVDISALAEALAKGALGGAAVDVFPSEPKSNDELFESPLLGMRNVILTPHIGGSTMEAQENIGRDVANKLVYFSDRGSTEGAVNFPSVNMPPAKDAHRVLHIHRNVPGILRQLNKSIADQDINVLGQYLATNEKIGYVVLDIAKGVTHRLLGVIRQIEGTIRTRVLY